MSQLGDILRGKPEALARLPLPTRQRYAQGYSTGTGRTTSAWLAAHQGAKWSSSATAYRCVNWIASNLASIDLTVLDGEGEPDDQHPVAQLWNRRPNSLWSARVQKEWAYSRAELTGEALFFLDRGATAEGDVQGIWPIFDPVEVLVDAPLGRADQPDSRVNGTLRGYRVRVTNGPVVPLLPSEVLWLRYPHPFDPWGALAPWKAALHAQHLDDEAKAWQLGEFRRGARPSVVVYLGDLDEQAHDAAVADFRTNVEGTENAGRSLLLSGSTPTRVDRLTLTPEEMSYIDSRVANSDEMMMAFGLRADLLKGEATYENQRASKVAAWSDLLVPKLEVLAGETDRQLLPDDTETAAFDVSGVEALREQADAVWQRVAQQGVVPDVLLLDEARAVFGYDPLPGGLGQQTLSAYRAQVTIGVQGGPVPSPRSLVPTSWRTLVVHGRGLVRVQPPNRESRSTPRKLSRPQTLAFYERNERIGQRAVKKLADKQRRVVLRKLRDLLGRGNPDQLAATWAAHADLATIAASPWTQLPLVRDGARLSADSIFDAAYWREVTQELFDAWLAGVWQGGAARTAEALGVDFAHFDRRVLVAMETRRDVLAHQVTATTQHVLEAQLLQAGVEGGESVRQLAARVTEVFADLAAYRAETIARTETVGGFNASSRLLAKESGVVLGRTWMATGDARTRETHMAMDGEHVDGMNSRYSNGLLHPGDPGGDPAETINCRCVETYDV